jgi:predicted glycosyltransferase involved in capsule biosynthesis
MDKIVKEFLPMEKLAVIVPYRNREEHLKSFIPHMEKTLVDEKIPFGIFIVEQADDKPFNRAKLLNVGFKECEEYDYFAFHDVDMLPVDSDYSFPDGPTHLSSEVEQFNWGLPYDGYFGGVTLFDKESFLKINGYSNEYWGWGAEDDDVIHRCMIKDIDTYRKQCRYRSLSHERNIGRLEYHQNLGKLYEFQNSETPESMLESDGVSSLVYEKISEEDLSKKTKLIKVKI